YKKYDYNRRYDGDDSEDIMQTSAALENLQEVSFAFDVHEDSHYDP
ncbi:hypothetical protein Tco_0549722, partial [Tanacetum coccineum]